MTAIRIVLDHPPHTISELKLSCDVAARHSCKKTLGSRDTGIYIENKTASNAMHVGK